MPIATPDIVILIVIGASAVIGLMRGFVRETVSVAIWIAAFLLAAWFGSKLGDLLGLNMRDDLKHAVGMVGVFLAVILGGIFLQRFLAGLVKATGLAGFDHLVGLLFGGVRGVIVVIVVLVALRPYADGVSWWKKSQYVPVLLEFEQDVIDVFDWATGWISKPEKLDMPDIPDLPKMPGNG